MLMALGGLLALTDRRYRVGACASDAAQARAAAAHGSGVEGCHERVS